MRGVQRLVGVVWLARERLVGVVWLAVLVLTTQAALKQAWLARAWSRGRGEPQRTAHTVLVQAGVERQASLVAAQAGGQAGPWWRQMGWARVGWVQVEWGQVGWGQAGLGHAQPASAH